jgi:hypothetical protein
MIRLTVPPIPVVKKMYNEHTPPAKKRTPIPPKPYAQEVSSLFWLIHILLDTRLSHDYDITVLSD